MFLYLCRIGNKTFFWFGRNTLTRLPLILLLRLNKLRVPIHNSVNRLWIFDVSWNPKAISKIVLTGPTVNFRLRVTVSNQFTRENTFAALNQYTLMKFSRYFSICLLDWIYEAIVKLIIFLGYTTSKHSFCTRSLKIPSLIGDLMRQNVNLLKFCQNFGLLCVSFQWRALQIRAQFLEENTEIFHCVKALKID